MPSLAEMKPRILYHASSNTNISMLLPRVDRIRVQGEGAIVFATPDKDFASMYLVPSDDSWTNKGQYNGKYICVVSDLERYKKVDTGGAIYLLSSDNFEYAAELGMGDREWVSRKAVIPLGKEVYQSGLQAMIELGVEVYVLNQKDFAQFVTFKRNKQYEESYQFLKETSTKLS